jgi:putative acetyltransferase
VPSPPAGDFFAPARALYAKLGFAYYEAFADYPNDPNSVHITNAL